MQSNTTRSPILTAAAFLFVAVILTGVGYAAYKFVYCEKISGKVIIVQQDAYAHKLALVQVSAVRRDDAIAWRDRVAKDCYFLIEEIRKEIADAQAECSAIETRLDLRIKSAESAKNSYLQIKDIAKHVWVIDSNDVNSKRMFFSLLAAQNPPRSKEIEELAMASKWQAVNELIGNDLIPGVEREIQKFESDRKVKPAAVMAASRIKIRELRDALDRMTSYDSLSSIPPTVHRVATDITDDSGEYSLRLPRGEYYVFASGSRRVFDKTETYSWAVSVSVPSQTSEKCLLGNMNLAGTGAGDLWEPLILGVARAQDFK